MRCSSAIAFAFLRWELKIISDAIILEWILGLYWWFLVQCYQPLRVRGLFYISESWTEIEPSLKKGLHWLFIMSYWLRLVTFLCAYLAAKFCPTLCDPMDCSLPGSSVHGILQARILEWVAISFSRGSSWSRIEPASPALAGRFFTTKPPGNPKKNITWALIL